MIKTLVFKNGKIVPSRDDIAIVTFASGKYTSFVPNLINTVHRWNPEIKVFVYQSEFELGCPAFSENPYAFKVYAIDKVRKQGFTKVIWCDSILKLIRPLDPIIERIEQKGIYLQHDGGCCGEWANDKSLEYFGVTRDEAMKQPCIWACCMGFDFTHSITNDFFNKWKKACDDGIFCGYWNNNLKTESTDERCKGHRHDQTCAQLIAYKMNIELLPGIVNPNPNVPNTYFTGRSSL